METTKTSLKRKLDEGTTVINDVKVQKREMYVNFQVILNGSPFKAVRLVLDNSCTFDQVPPKLMEIINKKVDNLGENIKFDCSVKGALLQTNQRIADAIDTLTEVVEFELTCDVKVNVTIFVDGDKKKNATVTVSTHDTYFHLMKNVKELVENRKDFNAQRYRVDFNASSIFVDGSKVEKNARVLQRNPNTNTIFIVRLITERVDLFQFVSSFF